MRLRVGVLAAIPFPACFRFHAAALACTVALCDLVGSVESWAAPPCCLAPLVTHRRRTT
jgi:hypothetical protein